MRRGLITAAVFKLVRESTLLSQEGLALALGVDRGTVQGWETARRPFTAVPLGHAVAVRHELARLGSDARLISYLDDAAEADFLLTAIAGASRNTRMETHPLGFNVLNRRVVELLEWATTGTRPRHLPLARTVRRGPVPDGPALTHTELADYATGAQTLIERSTRKPDDALILLHRQASFLAGPLALTDGNLLTPEAAVHLARARPWDPFWSDARTVSITNALDGNPEHLEDFLRTGLETPETELANLNYWAYYLGELSDKQSSDLFQKDPHLPWRGSQMLAHLVERLDPDHPLISLNIQTTWSLLTWRQGLVRADPLTGRALLDRCEKLLDTPGLRPRTRTQLASIQYAHRSELR